MFLACLNHIKLKKAKVNTYFMNENGITKKENEI